VASSDFAEPVRVIQLVESLARAGAEQSLVTMAPWLVGEGIELHVAFLIARDGLRSELEAAGVPVHCLDTGVRSRRAYLRETRRLIGQLHPDVVHTTIFEADLAGRVAAALARVPAVSSLVNTAYGRTESRELPAVRVGAAQLADIGTATLVTRFHAVTPHVADVMSRRLLIPRRKIEVIPRGRDPERLGRRTPGRRAAVRKCLALEDRAPVVLAVGRLTTQKGIDILLEALPAIARRHPDVRVLVAGRDGGAGAQLAEQAARLDVDHRVDFLGVRDDVADLMVAADVFAFPSRWEGAAGTVLEAMALECPVVCSALPTLAQTVDDTTAMRVPSEDPNALGRALGDVLADGRAASDRARAARRRFEDRFTIGAVARSTADLYRRVAAGRRHDLPKRPAHTP
jgi:glycosyltransferase involved in cell wall biosynthesis